MKRLVSITHNKWFAESNDPNLREVEPRVELVVILDEAKYELNNSQEVIQSRNLEQTRFIVSPSSLSLLIESLKTIQKDLQKREGKAYQVVVESNKGGNR